jgi:regulator of nonsense transcripts 2
MRQANLQIWDTGPTDVPQAALDSNLKKNTSFVTRVKQGVGVDAKEQLIKGLGTLKLDKYLEELLQVIPDGMSKCTTAKDSFAAAEVITRVLRSA